MGVEAWLRWPARDEPTSNNYDDGDYNSFYRHLGLN
jgi:hypothetical protein